MEHAVPTTKRQGGGWWSWGGTRRERGQQDPVWQSLVAQGGGPEQMGDRGGLGVVTLVPPLAGYWEGLGKEQGPEWMRSGRAGDRKGRWWWDGMTLEWDCCGVGQ